MEIISRIIWGIVGSGVGFLMAWKAEWIYQNFGDSAFAEKWLKLFGGTRLFIRLIGVLIVVISLMHMTGLLRGASVAVFGGLFSGLAGSGVTL
jgi:hypothetical protein